MSKARCAISFKSFTPNTMGYQAIMQSSAAGAACDAAAQNLAATANGTKKRGTYATASSIVWGDRRVSLAYTADYQAMIDEDKRRTLSRLVS